MRWDMPWDFYHPGDYNAGPGVNITYGAHAQFIQDTHQYTVMSYFDKSNTTASYNSYPDTLMLFDIYSLHQLYGANMTTRAGDTVYGLIPMQVLCMILRPIPILS